MPPPAITPQGSRTGLITWLVVFVVLFVTSISFAFYYANGWSKETQERDRERQANLDLVPPNAHGDPVVQEMVDAKRLPEYATATSALDVARLRGERLAKLISGQSMPPDKAADQAAKALAAAAARLSVKDQNRDVPMSGITLPPSDNLAGAVISLADQLASKEEARKALDTQLASMTRERDDAIAARQAMLAKKDEEIKGANDKAAEVQARVDQMQAEERRTISGAQNAGQVALRSAQAQLASVTQTNGTQQAKIKDLETQLLKLKGRLHTLRVDSTAPMIEKPNGSILRIPSPDTVYIDLGHDQNVTPGLTFEVYDKNKGIPPLGKDSANTDELPVGKASIEVIQVNGDNSVARIVKLQPGQQLVVGDMIKNLVFDPNTKYNFLIYGDFDLSNSGTPTAADANVVKRLVTQWGGKLTDQVNVDTDFVVMGKEPVLPQINDANDPIEQQRQRKAQEDLDRYLDIKSKAVQLSIPVLNQNRFLYFVGYYDQARR